METVKSRSAARIAVVGAGVAGITAAYLLGKRHDVTLIERNSYVGGHTNTIMVPDDQGGEIPVDTGFIVCNPKTYPLFYRLLDEWGVNFATATCRLDTSARPPAWVTLAHPCGSSAASTRTSSARHLFA